MAEQFAKMINHLSKHVHKNETLFPLFSSYAQTNICINIILATTQNMGKQSIDHALFKKSVFQIRS